MNVNENPYAPPRTAEPAPGAGIPEPGPSEPWDIGEVLGLAVEIFRVHWAVLSPAVVVPILLLVATPVARERLIPLLPIPSLPLRVLAQLVVTAAGLSLYALAAAGFSRMCLRAARGQPVSLGLIASGGDRLGAMAPLMMLSSLTSFVDVVLRGFAVRDYVSLARGLTLLQLFVLGLGLYLAPLFVVDQDLGPLTAVVAAWRATRGQRVRMLLYALTAALLLGLGLACCLIGLAAALPVQSLGYAIIYLRLTGRGGAKATAR